MKKKRTPKPDLETVIPMLIRTWRQIHHTPGPEDVLLTREFRSVVEHVRRLQNGLYVDRSLIGKDYLADSHLLGAYLLYPWIIHYQEALSLIGELPFTPRRVLDVCSGALPMAFAALRHGAEEVYATDRSERAMRLGAELCGRYGKTVKIRQWDCLKEKLPVEGKFDLIILGHCLEELFPQTKAGWADRQHEFVKNLLNRLSPEGCLLIVEGSYQEMNRRVLEERDRLVKEGVPVQAPCVWRGMCPALKGKITQCYAQRELDKPYHISGIQRAVQINLSSLKMSYLIMRHPKASWPSNQTLYRTVTPGITGHHGKKYYLCGTDGKKVFESRLKEHPKESRAFEYLKRGELISIENPMEVGKMLYIVKGTRVNIEAALGKELSLPKIN